MRETIFFEFHNIIPFFLDFYFWRKFNYRNLGKLDKKPCAFIIHRVAIFLISFLTRFRCSFLLLRQIILFLILIITRHPKKQPVIIIRTVNVVSLCDERNIIANERKNSATFLIFLNLFKNFAWIETVENRFKHNKILRRVSFQLFQFFSFLQIT